MGLKFDSKWDHRYFVTVALIAFGELDRSMGGVELQSWYTVEVKMALVVGG